MKEEQEADIPIGPPVLFIFILPRPSARFGRFCLQSFIFRPNRERL